MFKVNNKDTSGPLQFGNLLLLRKQKDTGEIIGPPAENSGPKTKEN